MVKREFIVERQGRSFVLYAGLLDLAHSQGLRAIRTQLLQLPSEENGQLAVVHAEVETDKGTFHGIGDAGPSNVARAMLNCTIRLAETRAKARALRDATDVGVAALEELGDLDEAAATPLEPRFAEMRHGNGGSNGHANGAANGPASGAANGPANAANIFDEAPGPVATRPPVAPINGLATQAQVRAIYSIARDQHGMSEVDVEERSRSLFGTGPAELSRKQASEFITTLKGNRS